MNRSRNTQADNPRLRGDMSHNYILPEIDQKVKVIEKISPWLVPGRGHSL
jgi:hypothetical protein